MSTECAHVYVCIHCGSDPVSDHALAAELRELKERVRVLEEMLKNSAYLNSHTRQP